MPIGGGGGFILASFVGPGNIVTGAIGWWGLRAYSAARVGTAAIRLRRDSDSAESDFNTLTNGNLDAASISTFKGAANLFVTTLYDQTGNGNNVVQATAANQPSLILSGIGNFPVIRFSSGGESWLEYVAGITQAQPLTSSWVAKRTTFASEYCSAFGSTTNQLQSGFDTSSGNIFMYDGVTLPIVAAAESSFHAVQAAFNGASSDLNVDGTAHAQNLGANGLAGHFTFSGLDNGVINNPLNGTFGNSQSDSVELGIWPSAFTGAQSTSMSANQHAYWGF